MSRVRSAAAEEARIDDLVRWLDRVDRGSRNLPAASAPEDCREIGWSDGVDG